MPAIDDPTRAARILAGHLAGTNPAYGTSKRGKPVMQGDTVVVPYRGSGSMMRSGTPGGKGVVYGKTGGASDPKLLVATGDARGYITASPSEVVHAAQPPAGTSLARTWDDLAAVIDLAASVMAVNPQAKTRGKVAPGRPPAGYPIQPGQSGIARAAASRGNDPHATPAPPAGPRTRRVPLTPMRQQAAKSMRRLAEGIQRDHPELAVHDHVRDAARTLESGNEEAAQRHLRAAMFSLSPQSLMRNGVHDDEGHISARQAVHGVHRHLLLVKDIADVAAKNQAAIRRDSYGDYESGPSLPHADPNAGYGPGALAQKPTQRQPGGDRALNAPDRTNSGGVTLTWRIRSDRSRRAPSSSPAPGMS